MEKAPFLICAVLACIVAVVVVTGGDDFLAADVPAAVAALCCRTLQNKNSTQNQEQQQGYSLNISACVVRSRRIVTLLSVTHLATIGVSPIVRGARMGMSALLHRNANASDELGPERRFVNHPLSFGSASSLSSLSATGPNEG